MRPIPESQLYTFTLKMEAVRHVSEVGNLRSHGRENIEFDIKGN
jgi:hypothetical protein